MRSRVPVVVSMIVGFIVGAGGGILAARIGNYGGEGASRPRLTKGATLDKLTQQLQLTPSQRDSLDAILDEGGKRMKELSQVVRPKFQEIKKQTRDRIRGILSPEQRTAFEKVVEEEDRKREAQKKSGSIQNGKGSECG